jgi:hypothetical protein
MNAYSFDDLNKSKKLSRVRSKSPHSVLYDYNR